MNQITLKLDENYQRPVLSGDNDLQNNIEQNIYICRRVTFYQRHSPTIFCSINILLLNKGVQPLPAEWEMGAQCDQFYGKYKLPPGILRTP